MYGFQLGAVSFLPPAPTTHLAMSQEEEMGDAAAIQWIEARNAAKHPTVG